MSTILRRALAPLLFLAVLALPQAASAVEPVPRVEVNRYLGTWKQLAAIPQWFDVGCLRDTTATYSLNADGTVRVANKCAGPLGTTISITGRARIADPVTNAQLQVTFLNIGGPVYMGTNYVIVGLADDYSWAVVTDPDRTSAFVLSRTATQPQPVLDRIRGILTANGINTCRLRVTKQAGGATTSPSFC
ncbi:MAG: lipocalin family protein [Solirubrobacteraceae bacterium]|nr:lipocalin family protein [Solirubrobacteraceae bacterium]